MTASLSFPEAMLRLAIAVVLGIVIGYNRQQHGKAAGMRTTVLVCVAAAVAMIQVNLLLPLAGRAPDSFVMNDLMRLPLGILTGVGFIGGGAILRRGDIVTGVTTAATLWLVTVIGLCAGGGQLALALAATAVGLFALWVLKWLENRLRREHRARLTIETAADGPDEDEVRRRLRGAGLLVLANRVWLQSSSGHRKLVFETRVVGGERDVGTPAVVRELAGAPGVISLEWQTQS